MLVKKNILVVLTCLLIVFASGAPAANAKGGNEYQAIVSHLKTKYQAKKVRIPFLWLARFAVSVVRPAGVKSFSITMFENVKFSRETLDAEMQTALKNSFSADWSPILRVRSREGEQVYMYMREDGRNVKLTLVTINKEQAAIIRATFNPEKFAEFINNPKVFGVSLSDKQANNRTEKPKEISTPEKKSEEPKKDSSN